VASKPAAPDLPPCPPSPRSPLPESRVVGGSRFWALADKSSDEEDMADGATVGPGESLLLSYPPSDNAGRFPLAGMAGGALAQSQSGWSPAAEGFSGRPWISFPSGPFLADP
jgi:hypothetical protein